MTITTREQATNVMRQCEGLETYLERIAEFHSMREDEYNDLMNALDAYFLSDDQRKALDGFDGNGVETYNEALRLGVDPEFACWLYL